MNSKKSAVALIICFLIGGNLQAGVLMATIADCGVGIVLGAWAQGFAYGGKCLAQACNKPVALPFRIVGVGSSALGIIGTSDIPKRHKCIMGLATGVTYTLIERRNTLKSDLKKLKKAGSNLAKKMAR